METARTSSMVMKPFWTYVLAAGCATGALVWCPPAVNAQRSTVEEQARPSQPSFALTFAPLLVHAEKDGQSASMLELTGEARLTDKLSAALVLGAGRVKDKATLWSPESSGRRFDVGFQGRYYLLGDFRHGMQLGAEFLYAADSYENPKKSVTFTQPGVFVGYKFTTRSGFTVDGQLGVRRIRETLTAGETRIDSKPDVRPLLNLNLGWSF